MNDYLPKEVREGLLAASRRLRQRRNRLKAICGGKSIPVLRIGSTGFTVTRDEAPRVRGLVDLYDGAKHLGQCLVVASEQAGDEILYEFKRGATHDSAPPADYVIDREAPIGLLPRPS